MANSYCQGCFAIEDVTSEEYAWLKEMTKKLEWNEEPVPELGDSYLSGGWTGWKFVPEVTSIEGDTITGDSVRSRLYVEVEENFDPEALSILLQYFLKKFRPKAMIAFEWAIFCSKLRPDEFGGGVMLVTADGAEFYGTANWLMDKLTEYSKKGYGHTS